MESTSTELVTKSKNPFGDAPVAATPQQSQALVAVEQVRAMSEVRAAIQLAKEFPRDHRLAMDRILNTCQREELASQALYSYARGGTEITGPSIRLAEAIAQNWQNLQFGVRELEQRDGESTVEAFAWDMETNVRQTKTFQVKHERHTKTRSYALTDPRDIYETVANQGARRLRACILGIIPGDVIDAAVLQCETTQKAKADTSPEALKKMMELFTAFKVTKEQIEKRIQRHLDAITPAQLISLRKIYTSLKDGMSSPGDWFEMPPEETAAGAAGATLKDKVKAAAAKLKAGEKAGDAPTTTGAETAGLPLTGEEMAPEKCPNNGEIKTKAVCDSNACGSRKGCPIWD
jgi:hypothetical protein